MGSEPKTLLCGEVPSVPIDLQHACVCLLPDFEFSEIFHEALLRCVNAAGRGVAIDGTKVQANASKHKAMSYERILQTELRLGEAVGADPTGKGGARGRSRAGSCAAIA